MKYIEFPSPFGVIFSLIMHPLVHTSGTLVSVSFRSYILSYDLIKLAETLNLKGFRLLSELYSLL